MAKRRGKKQEVPDLLDPKLLREAKAEADREIGEREKAREERGAHNGKTIPGSRCPVCKGGVSLRTTHAYYGDPMLMVIGPGHANQLTAEHTIFCPKCKIQFVEVPMKKKGTKRTNP